MTLSRKHFRALADILADRREDIDSGCPKAFARMVDRVAWFCRSQNSNFDADRFRAAVEKTVS